MDADISNFLYRNPRLYDAVFRTAPTAKRYEEMADLVLARNRKEPPSTILDLGCGTGFKLDHLHRAGYRCTGVDYLEGMVAYARTEYPGIGFEVGDIRDLRLGRTFDVITCLGWVLENVHSCADISRAMATFAAHSRAGSLLVFDAHNPIGDLHALGSRREFSIDLDGFTATAHASFDVDRRHHVLTRRRTWSLPGGATELDVARFRLLFPMEIEHYLSLHGFGDVQMYDNTDLSPSDLDGSMLYVTAIYTGQEPLP